MKAAVEEVLKNPLFRKNVKRLNMEMSAYDPAKLCERYITELLPSRRRLVLEEPESIY